jgi:hypothetical protein
MKKQLASYSTDTVQHVCGYKDTTAKDHLNLFEEVDKAFHASFARRGKSAPSVSRYHIAALAELEHENPNKEEAVCQPII